MSVLFVNLKMKPKVNNKPICSFVRELTNISLLKSFIHLRYVDVSKNKLKDISPLSALTHMLTLKADENLLTSARLEEMPFLQVASFNSNKITSTEGVNHPMLEHLSINSQYFKLHTIFLIPLQTRFGIEAG